MMLSKRSSNQGSGITVGSPVTDTDFFDREREIGGFIERIDSGAHILITAPRRIGKTSLLKEAARRTPGTRDRGLGITYGSRGEPAAGATGRDRNRSIAR